MRAVGRKAEWRGNQGRGKGPHQALQAYPARPATPSALLASAQDDGGAVHCRFCGKAFHGRYAKYNLKRHLMIHRGEKPFVCPYCPHRANQKGNLKYHILSVHPGRAAAQGAPADQADLGPKHENFASS
ncbi:hypothetical protein C7M84_004226 [Penaeus vannamei]|uniref:C2H2-type domain-containing protein n=1 Tax=Penaeus vannamei TaxID=6689 RepID=A0A3R7SVJ4_PENVA|nr:hypothetical protein C7M84_004226 [Penaeus vannamei]